MESILTSVKKLCGMTEEYTHFDEDIIMYVNDVFTTLARLGVGPAKGFSITDKDDLWSDFIDEDNLLHHKVKTYVKRKCQLQFDPPQSSAHLTALTNMIAEDEWRLVEIAESLAAESIENTETYPSTSTTPSTGGTSDYTKLNNLPKINGKTLIGNYDEEDPTVKEMSEEDVTNLWDELFEE